MCPINARTATSILSYGLKDENPQVTVKVIELFHRPTHCPGEERGFRGVHVIFWLVINVPAPAQPGIADLA